LWLNVTASPRRKVLIIDDSATARSLVRVFLMSLPVEFVEASSAEAALAMLEKEPVHVIIADHTMMGMDGITFVSRLRAHGQIELRGIPVVLLTGDRGEELRRKAMQAGASDFVAKPVRDSALRDAVERLLPH
jgi:two-component system chemotaxis response regulator CheY